MNGYTSTIRVGCGLDKATNAGGGAVRQCSGVADTKWVVGCDGSIAELACDAWNDWPIVYWGAFDEDGAWCLGVDECKAREGCEGDSGMHCELLLVV